MVAKAVKTETVVRAYDASGELLSETTTVQTQSPVQDQDDPPSIGFYL